MENTKSRVIKISPEDFFILRQAVVFFDKTGYFRASAWARKNRPEQFKKYMIDPNGFFPTGIIHRVMSHLNGRLIQVEILDNRVVPLIGTEDFKMRCSEPPAYPDQTKCTAALLKAKQGVAEMCTGSGKSRVIKDAIQQIGTRSIVITPSTALKEQMGGYLEDCFGADKVGAYDKRQDSKPITVINYHSFGKTDPREWADYHLVAIDEVHHGSNNTIFDFNLSHLNDLYYRFGLTATNFTANDDSAILLEAVLSNTVFSMPIKEAVEKDYIVPIMPIFYDISNEGLVSLKDKPVRGKRNTTKEYAADYKTFIDNNDKRNQVIRDLMGKMESQGIPSLTLVKHIAHGRELASDGAVFLNGADSNAKANQEQIVRFNRGKITQIVGTSVIGEGVDTKRCGAVINTKGGKSKKELLQNIGRALRKHPSKNIGFYFDFIDRGQKNLLSHSRTRMKIIEEEFGVKPKVIKL